MDDQLQGLLDRIQKEGVDKAQAEADQIVAEAKKDAEAILQEAGEKAKAVADQAARDTAKLTRSGEQALKQAARDVILSVGQAISMLFTDMIRKDVAQAMSGGTLEHIISQVVDSYCASGSGQQIEVILNEETRKEINDFFMARYSEELARGLQIKSDQGVLSGFRVSITKDKVEHDFSDVAIADALAQLLRPNLARIVSEAAGKVAQS